MFFSSTLLGSMELTMLAKLLLAALAGGILGIEREKHGRPAGLRTHLLVSLGSCLMMIISESFFLKYGAEGVESAVRLDPSRTAAQIIAGIGFLGAGVIIKEGINVRGLTTAASLWVVAGMGMAYGMGLWLPATFSLGLALCSLIFLKKLEPLIKKDRYLHLLVVADDRRDVYPELEAIFTKHQLRITDLEGDHNYEAGEIRYEFVVTQHKKRIGRDLSDVIREVEGVKRIRFK
jgi:putative Mg2+ transporter-C (MgtC) family protein